MEFPENEFFDAVPLSEALPVLAASNRARKVLEGALRDGELDDAIKMMQSKTLTDDLGGKIHDILVDEIRNECEIAWSAVVKHPEDEDYDCPISVCEYEGVYFVHQ